MIRRVDESMGHQAEPLLIRHLLRTPLATTPGNEIVHRDQVRYDHRSLRKRIGRLASALAARWNDAGRAGTSRGSDGRRDGRHPCRAMVFDSASVAVIGLADASEIQPDCPEKERPLAGGASERSNQIIK